MNRPVHAALRPAWRILVGLFLALAWMAPAAAPPAPMPSVEEIVKKLTRPEISPEDLARRAIAIEGQRARVEPPPSIDLAVNFEFASARLSPDARIVLDHLGQALAEPALSQANFRISGHTDARGSDGYNLLLSRQRARAVANYLVRQHHVDTRRLRVEGYGRSQLLDPANPESVVNRRVQIENLGP